MKKSMNLWSCDPKLTFEEVIPMLKEAGFDAVEFTFDKDGMSNHSIFRTTTDERLKEIKKLCDDNGLEVASVAGSLYGLYPLGKEETYKEAQAIIREHIHVAKMLGTDAILVTTNGEVMCEGKVGYPIDKAYEVCYKALCEMKDEIVESKVYVCLENIWNAFFASAFDMANFIDRLDCEYIKAYFDMGNVISFSDPPSWTRILGKRIKRVHVKDFKKVHGHGFNFGGQQVDIGEGHANFKEAVPELRNIGYDGYLSAEVGKRREYASELEYYKDVADRIQKYIIEA